MLRAVVKVCRGSVMNGDDGSGPPYCTSNRDRHLFLYYADVLSECSGVMVVHEAFEDGYVRWLCTYSGDWSY